jgi:transglutaminase-like putative cysteine protease
LSGAAARASRSRHGRAWAIAFILTCAVALGTALLYVSYIAAERGAVPRIDSVEPAIAEPGAVVTIAGANFGESRGDARVELAGISATQSAYRSWSDTEISVRLPPAIDTGLIRVITRAGTSNGAVFLAKSALPMPTLGPSGVTSGPSIESISPDSSEIGSIVAINGKDFGSNRNGGNVYFTWSGDPSKDGQSAIAYVTGTEPEVDYESWTDTQIRVRVPDGAGSGTVFVSTAKGRSNTAAFEVAKMPGRKTYKSRGNYAVSYRVTVNEVKATGPNDLYLWIPRPIEVAWQREVRPLSIAPEPLNPDYRGVAIFRLKDLVPNREARVELRYLVHPYAVETTVEPGRIASPPEPTSYMKRYLAPDPMVPSDDKDVARYALQATGGDRNPYRAAKAVYDWLLWNVGTETKGEASAKGALQRRKANSFGFALLYVAMLRAAGVPAAPVAGYLILPDRSAYPHCWAEFYVYGMGWVPVDPTLGTARQLATFVPPYTDPRKYFGSVDNRRIAFSRGYVRIAPMAEGGVIGSRERKHSLQELYEQSFGLSGYVSAWSDVDISF